MSCSETSRRAFLQHGACALVAAGALGLAVDAAALPVTFAAAETVADERHYPLPAVDVVALNGIGAGCTGGHREADAGHDRRVGGVCRVRGRSGKRRVQAAERVGRVPRVRRGAGDERRPAIGRERQSRGIALDERDDASCAARFSSRARGAVQVPGRI